MANADYFKQRWKIIFYALDPYGPHFKAKRIAQLLHISEPNVRYWIKRFQETGSVDDAPVSGRPRATSDQDEAKIDAEIEKDGPGLVQRIKTKLKKSLPTISLRTIQRRISERGLIFGSVVAKLLLSRTHIESRLKFATANLHRDWSNVIFTDESTFSTFTFKRKVWMKPDKKFVVRTVKHPAKLHAWGCFCSKGFGVLYLFTGTLDADRMVGIYKSGLKQSINMWFKSNDQFMLQEDNDPKHRSKKAESWKTENRIQSLEWPSMSPDLNPIENVWAFLKARLKENLILDLDSLEKALRKEWRSLTPSFAEKLAKSCSERCQRVIEAEGDYTLF